jgi:hypothetical protein
MQPWNIAEDKQTVTLEGHMDGVSNTSDNLYTVMFV